MCKNKQCVYGDSAVMSAIMRSTVVWSSAVTVSGKKLFLPNGRRVKSPWLGWDASLIMLFALPWQCLW